MSDDINYINLERLRTFLQEVKRLIPTNYATKTDLNNYFPKSGGQLSGTNISRNVDNETLHLYGGIGYGHGAFLQLTGKDESGNGDFNIQANNGSVDKILTGKADGTLTWDNKNIDVIEEQGDRYIRYSNGLQICWARVDSDAVRWAYVSFPVPFKDTNIYVSGTQSYANGYESDFKDASIGTLIVSSTVVGVSVYNSVYWSASIIAIGRWK